MPKPITPSIVYDLTSVAEPSLSPDGQKLAYVKSFVDGNTLKSQSNVFLLDVEEGAEFQFTSGTRDSNPRFSPDGLTLVFLRRDEDETRQIWAIKTDGGEARAVTSFTGGVLEYAWSPDSKSLAIISDVDPNTIDATDDEVANNVPQVKVVRRIRYRVDTLGWRGDAFHQLSIADVASGDTEQLTDGEGDYRTPVWSPDGNSIAYISDASDDRDICNDNAAYIMEVTSGATRVVSEGLHHVASLAWAPNSKRLVAIGSDDPEVGSAWQGMLWVLEAGSPPKAITDDSIRPAAGFMPVSFPPEIRWTSDDRVLFLADARGESFLCEASPTGGEARKLTSSNPAIASVAFDAKANSAVVSITPSDSTGNLHLIDLISGSSRQLTHENEDYFRDHPTATVQKFSLNRNGFEIESRVLLPPDFNPSSTYPMVLDIHGGPSGVFTDAFNPIQQVLTSQGYVVLAVNPRGSSTYGMDFLKTVHGDWGGEDYLDIMAAVDEMSEKPYIDADRLGITGYSYGGYMSGWIIGHDTRFKAAVLGAPVTSLTSMYGTSDIGVRFLEVHTGGPRHSNTHLYSRHSPLTYVDKVETPVLLLHGEADNRCPIEQSEQYFVALLRLGKEAEFVRFPDCSHSMMRSAHPRMKEEYLARMLDWFQTRIGAPTPVV
jgi:dipeptidyl aminopeptidase/acylaminoacyl peptidase